MRMGRSAAVALVGWGIAGATIAAVPQPDAQLRDMVSADNIRETMRVMTAHPTTPGTAFAKENAERTLKLFRSWGWQVRIEPFRILFPHPKSRTVELVSPTRFVAKLHEPPLAGDTYSQTQQGEQIASYFIYSPDGDVTAPVVYVNYGLRDDYDELTKRGISVKGAIVLVRYGRMWRGGKVELAAEHGAVGALLYSDPKDDGFYQGPVYPEGPWRSPDSVQRGSVINGAYPGDPLSPGFASTPNAKRLSIAQATSLAKIPAMPLSYADAQPFLAALDGQTMPPAWRGALPVTYRSGPGPAVAHLSVKHDWDTVTIYDVIATLPGGKFRNEWVVRGNHRDGWVYGAQDPHSGHAAMLEEARALGSLYKAGWRPKRTIVYASWDAEEQGTIGSTEWMEAHLPELQRKAVAYINSDVIAPGTVEIRGSQSFQQFATELAQTVVDPQSGLPAFEHLKRKVEADARAAGAATDAGEIDAKSGTLQLSPPGYGSDHAAFVERSGIPVLTLEFGGSSTLGGAYHSIYDNFAWFDRFGDDHYRYARAGAQLNGTAVIRLADADLLPFRFGGAANGLARQADQLQRLATQLSARVDRDNKDVAAGIYASAGSPANPYVKPAVREVPTVDLSPIADAVVQVERSAASFDATIGAAGKFSDGQVSRINRAMLNVEQSYLRPDGLPGRRWFRNEFYSPGRLWDDIPAPAVGEPLLEQRWSDARAQVLPVGETLTNIAAAIDRAKAALSQAASGTR